MIQDVTIVIKLKAKLSFKCKYFKNTVFYSKIRIYKELKQEGPIT